jgi:hypothetical protein
MKKLLPWLAPAVIFTTFGSHLGQRFGRETRRARSAKRVVMAIGSAQT